MFFLCDLDITPPPPAPSSCDILSTLGEGKGSFHRVQQEKRKECINHYLVLALVFSGSFSLKKWEKKGGLEEVGKVRTGNKQPLAAQACRFSDQGLSPFKQKL